MYFYILYPSFQDNHKMAATYKKNFSILARDTPNKEKKTHTNANANAGLQ